ncbi:MAG: hypothetical protein ACE5MB_05015 [Anaerolineae bacterium]
MERAVNGLFVKHLVAKSGCAVCEARYRLEDIHILAHQGDYWVMAVDCEHCHTQGLVFAVVQEEQGPQVVTDLTPREWAKFRDMPPLEADDVLDVHEFLQDFDGDFIRLFRGRPATEDENT